MKNPTLANPVLANCHSASNLPFLSKLTEKLAKGQLQVHLTEANTLAPTQSGSRPGYRTETALVALVDDPLLSVIEDKHPFSSSLQHSILDYEILLCHVREMTGVQGNAIKWFEFFLEGRIQRVVMGNCNTGTRSSLVGFHNDQFFFEYLFISIPM